MYVCVYIHIHIYIYIYTYDLHLSARTFCRVLLRPVPQKTPEKLVTKEIHFYTI